MQPTRYHKYTDEDLEYIRTHCRDDYKEVASVIGAPPNTVRIYMNRFRDGTFVKKSFPPQKYYALYLRKTDELVCSGTAKECAASLGINTRSFYKMAHTAKHNQCKKWDVLIEPYEEIDE